MNEPSKKARTRSPERITLTSDALLRINSWMDLVKPQLKGSQFTRCNLVNWLISSHETELSDAEVRALSAVFFDPMKALAWASREILERQKAGEQIDVAAFMSDVLMTKSKPVRRHVNKTTVREKGEVSKADLKSE